MKLSMLKNIIFDMDGVIVDSNPIHEEAERLSFIEFGMNVPREEWRSFKGKTAHDIVRAVVSKYGSQAHDIDKIAERRTELFMEMAQDQMRLVPGAGEFIRKARQKYTKLAITTSSKQSVLEVSLTRYGLLQNFDAIVTGDEISKGKPDPQPYEITLAKMDAKAAETLVIEDEDADNGVISAKRAGCYVAALTTSLDEQALLDAGADIVCSSYAALTNKLELEHLRRTP
jgi:beta-phosphoglucomutase